MKNVIDENIATDYMTEKTTQMETINFQKFLLLLSIIYFLAIALGWRGFYIFLKIFLKVRTQYLHLRKRT